MSIDKETAELEFMRWAESMDLDFQESSTDGDDDDDDKKEFKKQKSKVIAALQNGALLINDNGEAVYTPRNPKTKHKEAITFYERTGESLASARKSNGKAAHIYAPMASVTKLHSSAFVNMVGIDIKTCEAIFSLLMD